MIHEFYEFLENSIQLPSLVLDDLEVFSNVDMFLHSKLGLNLLYLLSPKFPFVFFFSNQLSILLLKIVHQLKY